MIVKRLRETRKLPILFLSSKEEDKFIEFWSSEYHRYISVDCLLIKIHECNYQLMQNANRMLDKRRKNKVNSAV